MRKLLRLRPSASLIVATAALVAALSGGAYATGTFSSAPASSPTAHAAKVSDKKSDKKIANTAAKNYFNNHIAGASVSHANTANTANSANTAASATNATNAGTANNANNLGGLAPATFLNRAAQRADTTTGISSVPLTSGNPTDVTIPSPASITVPAGVNFVHATGVATLAGGSATTWIIWLQMDGACALTGPGANSRPYDAIGAGGQAAMTATLVFPVTAGVHTFRLCAQDSASGDTIFDPVLTVETVAAGATGGTTLGPVAHSGAKHTGNPTVAH